MGYFGKLEEKKKAISLRRAGLSYSQIKEQVGVSKSTLSLWCRSVEMSGVQLEKLNEARKYAAKRGSIIAANNKRNNSEIKATQIQDKAIFQVGRMNKRERFVAGISLYLGDGYKTKHRFGFSNADPRIIQFMFRWLAEFTEIEKSKIRGRIWLHDDLSEEKAKNFWSNLLSMDHANFIKSYVVKNKTDSNKIRKNIHQYGVFSLIVNSKELQNKMIGFMTGILTN